MARTVTLLSLRTQVRQRADMVGATFVTDSELTGYLNASLTELYDVLVKKFEDFYVSSADTTLVSGTQTYALPNTFYKLLGVDVGVGASPTQLTSLRRFNFAERNTNPLGTSSLTDLTYALQGSLIRLFGSVPSGCIIRVWFVPAFTSLVADADTFDGVNGWEEFAVIDAAIKCLQKEESDVSVLMAQKQGILARIESSSSTRDSNEPSRVIDLEEIERNEGLL